MKNKFEHLQGIVINTRDYQEYDRIISIDTKEKGLITCLAKSARKSKAKMTSALTPWNYINLDIVKGKNWPIIKGVSIKKTFSNISKTENNLLAAQALSEIILKTIPEGNDQPSSFDWLKQSLEILNKQKLNPEIFINWRLFSFINSIGYKLNLNLESEQFSLGETRVQRATYLVFDFHNSVFKSIQLSQMMPRSMVRINKNVIKVLRIFEQKDWPYIKRLRFSLTDLKLLSNFLKKYYEWHINSTLYTLKYFNKS